MLHEVLLSALGYTGDLIDESFQVNEKLVPSLISHAEAELVGKIAGLGRHYVSLLKYTESGVVDEIRKGLIERAVSNGIGELLSSYRETICNIESHILDDPSTPLTRIRYMLREYEQLLPIASTIIHDIEEQGFTGGQILAMIYRRKVASGVPRICQLLDRLLYNGHIVLYNMLESWMLRGALHDPYDEFFLTEEVRNVVYPFTESSAERSTSGAAEEILQRSEYEWNSQVSLRLEMLPSGYLRPETAAKVMFVGKAVRVLQAQTPKSYGQRSSSSNRWQTLRSEPEDFSATPAKDPSTGTEPNSSTFANLDQHADSIAKLRSQRVLDAALLENTIEQIYWDVAKRLWSLVVTEARLVDHLGFVREFFFLGRGEFFSFFIQSGRALFASPPSSSAAQAEAAVRNGPWREAAAQCDLDDDEDPPSNGDGRLSTNSLFPRLSIHLAFAKFDFSKSGFASPNMGTDQTYRSAQVADLYLVGDARQVFLSTEEFDLSSVRPRKFAAPGAGRLPSGPRGVVELVRPWWQAPKGSAPKGTRYPNNGACWYANKVPVDQGFETEMTVQFPKELGSESQVAFVVHNSSEVGPTALGKSPAVTEANGKESSQGTEERWLGGSFHGISNSVAVCLHHSVAGRSVVGVYSMGQGQNRSSLEATIASAELDLSRAGNDEPVSSARGDHVLRVKYDLEGGDAGQADKPFRAMRVFLDDQQVLFCRFELAQVLLLDPGTSSAWVGAVASKCSLVSPKNSLSGEGKDLLLSDAAHPKEPALQSLGVRLLNWRFNAHAAGSKSYDYDPWRHSLSLRMAVPWPLHLVITQEALTSYNMVFQFLLAVKRVGDSLKSTWAALVQLRFKQHRIDESTHTRLMMLWRLRASMAFFVDNLQYHLQVDVIDSLFEQLQSKICQSLDFDTVLAAHKEFIHAVVTRSFLHNKVVLNGLDSILRTCLRFCKLAEHFSLLQSSSRAENLDKSNVQDISGIMDGLDKSIENLCNQYSHDIKFLFTILKRLNSNLLLRIDFNGHFTALTKDIGVHYKYQAPDNVST